MKMKKETKKKTKAAVSSKRGKLAAAACMMLLALGTAGVFIFTGESIQTTEKTEEQTTTTTTSQAVTTTTTTADTQTQTATGQIIWRKAGISEYEVANAKQTVTTTTTTSQTTTTTTPAPTQTTTQAATTTKAATTTTKAAVTTTAKPATTTVKTTTKPAATTTAASKTVHHSASENIKYTAEEFDMMCYVVQAEVGNCSEAYKIAVANVIINRVKSSRFAYATSIKAVLTAGGQFDSISNYYSKRNPPNQSTINCCKRALAGEDNSNGAVYYYSPKICGTIAWFESMQVCLYLDSGLYSAKFFKPW